MLIIVCVNLCITLRVWAQKIPYTFSHEAGPSRESSLVVLTNVNESASTFLRLYFKGTQLGDESYLILEGTDGARQELRKKDLENWSFSSAYFNGSTVKVSLFSAEGEKNMVFIDAIKVSDGKIQTINRAVSQSRENLTNQTPSTNSSTIDYDLLPHAAAVGRFSNGNKSYGTGWIAANGAIVSAKRILYDLVVNGDYDIIEFNIPASANYGTVNHPGPEDQYPLRASSINIGSTTFDFKNKYHYDISKEEDYGEWTTSWAIIEALPNSTGLRPGERQQQYFQVARNPGSFTLESLETPVDIFHYGETTTDIIYGTQYRTLKRYVAKLLPSEEYLDFAGGDRDDLVLYTNNEGDITLSDSDAGAPITYSGYNIAIGVHNDFLRWPPSVGTGFRDNDLLSGIDNFFSTVMVYVDQASEWDASTGAIDKPYFEVWDGIEGAEIDGIVNIVKGNYNEPMYITKAVTLVAPVGNVVIGESGVANARKATLPQEFFTKHEADDLSSSAEENENSFDLKNFPNPFTSSTAINYSITEPAVVQVNVYDKSGTKIRSLVQQSEASGTHSVVWDGNHENGKQATPGLYVIRIETALESTALKVIKK